MNSDGTSWLDVVKERKWVIIVVIICIFAGISYFAAAISPSGDTTAYQSSAPDSSYPSTTPTPSMGTERPTTASFSPTPTVAPVPVGTAQQAPTPSDWRPTANAFAKAWANPKAGQQAWLDALKPTVTSNLYNEFQTTDVGRMMQLEVSAITPDVEDYTGVNATVAFKNTDFKIKIHLTPLADMSWRVSVVTT